MPHILMLKNKGVPPAIEGKYQRGVHYKEADIPEKDQAHFHRQIYPFNAREQTPAPAKGPPDKAKKG